MSLKKIIGIGAIAASLLFSKDAELTIKDKHLAPNKTSSVEMAFRRLDPFVEWYVEQDYTNKEKEGHVSLRSTDKTVWFVLAAYDPEQDIIKIPDYKDEKKWKKAINAIPHELWHALSDSIGNKGLLYYPDYEGPDMREIAEYCKEKTKLLNEIIKRKNKYVDVYYAVKDVNNAIEYYKDVLFYTVESAKWFNRDVRPYMGIIKEMDKKFYHNIIESIRRIRKKHKRLWYAFRDQYKWVGDILQLAGKLAIKKDIEGLTKIQKEIADSLQIWDKEYGSLLYDVKGFISSITKFCTSNNLCEDVMLDAPLPPNSIYYRSRDYIEGDIARLKLYEILGTDEIMARMVASLYNPYYGQPTINYFQLTEKDLEFLEKFTYNGKPIFRKGIEKYKVGLEMIKDGMDPKDVSELLRDATHFIYKGKEYNWPEANFKIKGYIPYE
ncbi:MAG TPA: hypothetical protein ENF30_00120 [Candidatus Desulfofervidus auxilii]|uniref:Uncharacterized protein n=1 Tax=Desulfofervidus auxilii TaxID=1621989 RepID=A0A7V0I9Q9_DESA2|nr:MAG: hypothetical protein DRP03_00225 [Candidatus Aenigmarchaeota archaeon]HDD35186.1 hypothetical protein [Candidatus Desulfofervidus auxilii]